jgi:hypothetical protein
MVAKLFVVTRRDLDPGSQAVQGMHAYGRFEEQHPATYREWYAASNTLAFLSVSDEGALGVLYQEAVDRGLPVAAFREPDRDNELTAIALGPKAKRLCQGFDLALRTPRAA